MSEHQAARFMDTAHQAHDLFPAALAGLACGAYGAQSFGVIIDEAAVFLSLEGAAAEARRAAYEAAILPHARVETPNRLRPIARRLAIQFAELPVADRHEEAAARSCVQVREADDGMAELTAFLPAPTAYAIRDRVKQVAKSVIDAERAAAKADRAAAPDRGTPGPTAERKLPQVEADVLADILLVGEVPVTGEHSTPVGRRVRAQVQVIVPGHALGLGAEGVLVGGLVAGAAVGATGGATGGAAGGAAATLAPGGNSAAHRARVGGVPELIGYGPISDAAGRSIAADSAAWEVVSVNFGGTVLSVERYRPTPAQFRFLAARDVHCRAPGCRAKASRSDVDHTIDAAKGGTTSTDNLAVLCRGHHVLKHHSNWRVEQHDGGVLTWTSPTGHEHVSQPPSRVRFRAHETVSASIPPHQQIGGEPTGGNECHPNSSWQPTAPGKRRKHTPERHRTSKTFEEIRARVRENDAEDPLDDAIPAF